MAAVIHARAIINGKVQQYRTLCNTSMGIRGQQIYTDNPEEVTCKRCLLAAQKKAKKL